MEEISSIQNLLAEVFEVTLRDPVNASSRLTAALSRLKDKYKSDPSLPNSFNIIVSFILKIVEQCEKCPDEFRHQIVDVIQQLCPDVHVYHTVFPEEYDFINELLDQYGMRELWASLSECRPRLLNHVDRVVYDNDPTVLTDILKKEKYNGISVPRIWSALLDIYGDISEIFMTELKQEKYSNFFDWMRETLDHKRFDELKMYLPTWTDSLDDTKVTAELVAKPYNVCRYFKNMFINTVKFEESGMTVTYIPRDVLSDILCGQMVHGDPVDDSKPLVVGLYVNSSSSTRSIFVKYPSLDDVESALEALL